MAFSYEIYTANGTTDVFNIPFAYLDKRHVSVFADGVKVSFSWLSSQSVKTALKHPADTKIMVRRFTPNTTPLVDFTDGATLTERDLDLLAFQSIMMNQEAVDLSNELVDELEEETEEDITKLRASVRSLNVRALEAVATANEAVNTAGDAVTRMEAAEAYISATAGEISGYALAATTGASTATDAATAAQTAAANCDTARTETLGATAAALSYRDEAAAAAATATLAANFDPTDFYTREENDALLSNLEIPTEQVTGLTAALAAKAATTHSHAISSVTGLQTALDNKLATSANAASASKLATARTISLAGDVTGSVTFNGSTNVSMTTSLGNHNHPISQVTNLQSTLDGLSTDITDRALKTRTITGGNGLTGGGSLGTDRVISLGTPSAITAASINEVTTTSHTHSFSNSSLRSLYSETGVNTIGSYALLVNPTDYTPMTRGTLVAGSQLRFSACNGYVGASTSGTWMLMGEIQSGNNNSTNTSLWLRIS